LFVLYFNLTDYLCKFGGRENKFEINLLAKFLLNTHIYINISLKPIFEICVSLFFFFSEIFWMTEINQLNYCSMAINGFSGSRLSCLL